jgi:hypothetical protein
MEHLLTSRRTAAPHLRAFAARREAGLDLSGGEE